MTVKKYIILRVNGTIAVSIYNNIFRIANVSTTAYNGAVWRRNKIKHNIPHARRLSHTDRYNIYFMSIKPPNRYTFYVWSVYMRVCRPWFYDRVSGFLWEIYTNEILISRTFKPNIINAFREYPSSKYNSKPVRGRTGGDQRDYGTLRLTAEVHNKQTR